LLDPTFQHLPPDRVSIQIAGASKQVERLVLRRQNDSYVTAVPDGVHHCI